MIVTTNGYFLQILTDCYLISNIVIWVLIDGLDYMKYQDLATQQGYKEYILSFIKIKYLLALYCFVKYDEMNPLKIDNGSNKYYIDILIGI